MQTVKVGAHQHEEIVLRESGDYLVELAGEGAEADISGAFEAKADDLININLTVAHRAAHTHARTSLKGVARDKSSVRFFGLIKIDPNCPDSQSMLEERVLLLSDSARAEAIPQLEILTDDVRCSHAASISPIPESELFYLQSRGIPKLDAEQLIVDGFLGK